MSNYLQSLEPVHFIQSRAMTVQELLPHGDIGLLVPHHYPEYTWGVHEVNRLLKNISQCVFALTYDQSAIRYLGPIILLSDFEKEHSITRVDRFARPQRVYSIADGQQRLATIALIASQLYQRIASLQALKASC